MAYDEYDYSNESNAGSPSLKESLYNILNGFQNEKNLRETGQGLTRLGNAFPGVVESVGRGALASVPGVIGDTSDFARTYAPNVMNDVFGPRAFNTTREILNNIPRITPSHEGAETLEDVGAAISPGIGGVLKDTALLTKGLPVGLSIKDVSKEAKNINKIDELGFHSSLENAVNNIGQPKGTGEQFLKQLEKTPGVKTEELEVTGLKNYLQEHPTVTKQEVIDHINQNKVKLENKVLSEPTGETAEDYQLQGGDVYHDQDYIDSTAEDLRYQLENDADIYHQEKEALVERFPELYEGHEKEPDVAARLNQHVEENIKELADTQAREMYYENPIRHYYDEHGYDIYGNDDNGYSIKDPYGNFLDIGGRNGIYDLSDAEAALRGHLLDEGVLNIDEEGAAKYEDYTLPGKYTNYREVLTTHQPNPAIVKQLSNGAWTAQDAPNSASHVGFTREDAINSWRNEQKNYESSHYDEPNILAHTRLNDRIINGKKTLMVEEIQSDWHQAGRRKGYLTGNPKKELNDYESNLPTRAREAMKENALKDGLSEKEADDLSTSIVRNTDFDGMVKYLDETDKYKELFNKTINKDKLVPDAPFKKNWHELMMKQILNEAVKGNYDAVAFTTGKQQAARYSLSKQIDSLDLIPAEEGVKQFVLNAYKDGRKIINKEVNEDELPDLIGKEAAKKLLEQETTKLHRPEGIAHGNPNVFTGRNLSGLDLDVGGEGMKGFYDKILPDFVNKYGKKYGIGVKKEHLTPPDNDRFMNFKDWAVQKDPSINDTFLKHSWNNKDDLYKEFINTDRRGDEVHYFDLTDAAKKDIKEKGQPMFAGIGLAGAPMMDEHDQKKNGILKDIAKSKK
jgi:hypothetical protein